MIKWYQFLSIWQGLSNTSFWFRHKFLLSAHSSQSHTTSCSSLMSHHRVNNKCNRGQHWRWLIYALALRNFLLHNVTCFQKQPLLFLKVSQIPQENTCVGVSFSFKMTKLYKDISSAWIICTSAEIDVINVSKTQ